MQKLRIQGPTRLSGRIRASGAKNAALPLLAATLLTDEPVTLTNMPQVRDIRSMATLLAHLGQVVEELDHGYSFKTAHPELHEAPYDMVKTMRAGALVLGPLVAHRGRARVSLPGGCAIGVRPIDQHLAGLEALGAEIDIAGGYVEASAERLRGTRFRFKMPTVGGTENVLMAAVLAEGETVLENCAREPEIVDLARFLNLLGAKIEGAGLKTIHVEGVERLGGGEHPIIPDRIETGTYLIGAAMTGGDVTVEAAAAGDIEPLLQKLREVGATVEVERGDGVGQDTIRVAADGELDARGIVTEPHPGYPTDLQAQYMALMTQADGVSAVSETVFENRFQHVPELVRMGAEIVVEGTFARIHGPRRLSGASVMATDLRASACLVLAGLAAEGETVVDRIYHLDRGYERMEEKLRKLGADVERFDG